MGTRGVFRWRDSKLVGLRRNNRPADCICRVPYGLVCLLPCSHSAHSVPIPLPTHQFFPAPLFTPLLTASHHAQTQNATDRTPSPQSHRQSLFSMALVWEKTVYAEIIQRCKTTQSESPSSRAVRPSLQREAETCHPESFSSTTAVNWQETPFSGMKAVPKFIHHPVLFTHRQV